MSLDPLNLSNSSHNLALVEAKLHERIDQF